MTAPSTNRPADRDTRNFSQALKLSGLKNVAFTLIPKGNGHGLNAAATLTTPGAPNGVRLGISHDLDGHLQASYGTEPSQPIPDIDRATLASVHTSLDTLEHLRDAAENLYRARMQEAGVRLAAVYTERLMTARAAGDTTFDVLAELPYDDLAEEGLNAVAHLNALATVHT